MRACEPVVWSSTTGLFAARVTADGKVAGPQTPLWISDSREVSACWTGSIYLVTWRDGSDNSIYAATLSREGQVLAVPYLVVRRALPRSGSLASNGRRSFMAYSTIGVTPVVKGALFDAGGAVIAVDLPLPVSDIVTSRAESVPRVSTDGNEFALVWRSGESVPIKMKNALSTPPPLSQLFHTFHLLRISDSGVAIGTPIVVGRVEQTGDFDVTFGAGVYAIAALEKHLIKPAETQPRLVRFAVDPRGGVVTALPAIDTFGWDAAVLWNGSRFIAYWMDYSPSSFVLLAVPFSGAQETTPPQPASVVSGAHLAISPLLAWNGKSIVGAWSEDIFNTYGAQRAIRGAILDSNAAASEGAQTPFLISIAWSRQFTPAIATSGPDSLIVWIESSEHSKGRLLGLRIRADGVPIDSTPLEIAPVASVSQMPRVTFAGAAYLVVWGELDASNGPTTIIARRVGQDGSLGPRDPLGPGWGAAVASNGMTALVAFGGQHVVGYRFDARAQRLDTMPIAIGDGYSPQIATNGTDFFVAWNVGSDYWQFSPPDLIDVLGARVTTAGAVDAAALPIATGPSDQFVEAVGSDGRDYTVFFGLLDQRHRDGVLAAKRVLREGQLDGTTPQEDGVIVGGRLSRVSLVRSAEGFWLGGLKGGYPYGFVVLVRTDFRGNAGEPISLVSYRPDLLWSAFLSLAQATGGPLQIAYSRRLDDAAFTSRAFLRLAVEGTDKRSRAVGH